MSVSFVATCLPFIFLYVIRTIFILFYDIGKMSFDDVWVSKSYFWYLEHVFSLTLKRKGIYISFRNEFSIKVHKMDICILMAIF